MSERDTIIQQFVKFCMLHTEIPEINDYIYPSESCKAIGDRTGKFTISNYIGRYNETLENNNYQILFYDESLISFFYEFDEIGNVSRCSLSFIPSVDVDIDLSDYKMDEVVKDLLLETYGDYLRIDFDETGYRKAIHTRNHMHRGIGYRSKDCARKEIRFPFLHLLYPLDFIDIICRYVYHVDESVLEKLTFSDRKRIILESDEQQLLALSFNANPLDFN
jgi:hypothetical protein